MLHALLRTPLFILTLLLALPAIGQSVAELKETLAEKKISREDISSRLAEIDKVIRNSSSTKLDLELEIKSQERQIRKIKMLSSPDTDPYDQNNLKTAKYKLKVAQIALAKHQGGNIDLKDERRELETRLGRLDKVIADINSDIASSKASQKQALINKKKQQQAQAKAKVQQAAAKEKQRQDQAKQQQANAEAAAAQAKANALKQQQAAKAAEAEAIRKKQEQLMAANAGLSAADAAVNTAKIIAMESIEGEPLFGLTPELKLSNPVGSSPKSIGSLTHLGNNQYYTEITLKKGRQHFVVGEHKYFKLVAKAFNGKNAVLVIDARDAVQPVFQIVTR